MARFHTCYLICEAVVGLLVLATCLCMHGTMQEPMIQSVFPSFGPRSGGTQLSVGGRHLNIGSQLLVHAASQPCTVIRSQTTAEFPCTRYLGSGTKKCDKCVSVLSLIHI